jgi:hypothetical protein
LVDDLFPLLLIVPLELEVTVVVRRTGLGAYPPEHKQECLLSVLRSNPLRQAHCAGLTIVSQEEDRSHNRDKVQRQTENVSDDTVYAHEPFPSDRLGDGLAELGDLSTGRGLGGGESAFLDELAVVLGEQDLRHEEAYGLVRTDMEDCKSSKSGLTASKRSVLACPMR